MPPPKAIDSAYNFVPLSRFVLEPAWGKKVSHDVPFRDGVSGRLKLTITAHTPILVARDRAKKPSPDGQKTPDSDGKTRNDQNACFFQLRDKTYAIPGSALRGMIRNVIEIAGFGAMGMVDDRRLGVRDLTPGAREFYGNELTTRTPTGAFVPRSRAGWLKLVTTKEGPQWQLTPCEFARVEHNDLERHRPSFRVKDRRDSRNRPAAHKIYEEWKKAGGSLDVDMQVSPPSDYPHQRGRIRLNYRRATFAGKTRGTLVFTGQPGPNKHMEFFFFNRSGTPLPVRGEVMTTFRGIHEENEDWTKHWKDFVKKGREAPVFWLANTAGEPEKIGLAMMFRLAYDRSIGEVIANTSGNHREGADDLATLMFGRAAQEAERQSERTTGSEAGQESNGEGGLKGRVSFGLACATNNPQPIRCDATVLNTPKPTYYPNYVRQPLDPRDRGRLAGDRYATYTPQAGAPELQKPEIRGWKRYPVRPPETVSQELPRPPEDSTEKVQSILHPLRPGTVFKGEMRFHNLMPEELGGLLWALEWGGDGDLRHTLGMGKAFGFGQVSIKVDRTRWNENVVPNDLAAAPRAFDDYITAFIGYMEEAYRNEARARAGGRPPAPGVSWAKSEQIVQLLAMADPRPAARRDFPGELRAMSLATGGLNEFIRAKGNRREGLPSLVLAEYARFTGLRDAAVFSGARPERQENNRTAGAAGRTGASGPRATASRQPSPLGRFGFQIGQQVAVGGEFGKVTGFTPDKVEIDFGDGPEATDPDDVDRR